MVVCRWLIYVGIAEGLTATYVMVIAASVILFGANIGRWIDKILCRNNSRTSVSVELLEHS